ncbi:hypothetical protein DFS34DRAFT_638384, partial [Phlyctochytrium arcticum]
MNAWRLKFPRFQAKPLGKRSSLTRSQKKATWQKHQGINININLRMSVLRISSVPGNIQRNMPPHNATDSNSDSDFDSEIGRWSDSDSDSETGLDTGCFDSDASDATTLADLAISRTLFRLLLEDRDLFNDFCHFYLKECLMVELSEEHSPACRSNIRQILDQFDHGRFPISEELEDLVEYSRQQPNCLYGETIDALNMFATATSQERSVGIG